jgi:decaprenylphospho-beta-D-ribofuranose 2-oxidase
MGAVRWKSVELSGWGRVRRARSLAARAERISDLAAAIAEDHAGGISIYGSGRSYGDSALNAQGHSCLTGRLNRILAFDETSGIVEVEPGVTFRQLLDVFLPKGWIAPVTPGTAFATIAGAVAHDVHGKNHERDGSFGQHVTEIDLLTPDGLLRTLGPRSRPAWFRATCGGCGLTGIMTRIAFRMHRVPGGYVKVTRRRFDGLEAFLEAFEVAKDTTYSVGWIDAVATGRDLGRGILETAEPAVDTRPIARSKQERAVPFELPLSLVNPTSVKAFNALYFHSASKEGAISLKPYSSFLYPLDAVGSWNRIYGKRGFHQFQCVVPYTNGDVALRRLLEAISSCGAPSFLSVLKRLGPGRAGYLSFPMEGYTLAVDFPNNPTTELLYRALVHLTLDHGGRVYLAKDALLWPEAFAQMYPELDEFRQVLDELDPMARLQSDMARRLQVRAC